MDPITTAILSWLTGEAGTAGVRIIGSLARGDRQQRALETIVARSVDAAVDGVVADPERADVRDALLRELPQDTDAVRPGDILDLDTAVSRVLGPRLELLQEQGYRIDSTRLTNTLARLIRQGIQADADRGGPLAPLAEHIRHERVATASEATAAASEAMAGDLRAIRRTLMTAAKDRTIQDTGRERVGQPIADLAGPLALGVHQAVSAGDTRLPVLPEYVPRDHDAQLRAIMEAADQASRMIVLAGDSSTGKTRALWEALRYLPDHWWVWSPATALNFSVFCPIPGDLTWLCRWCSRLLQCVLCGVRRLCGLTFAGGRHGAWAGRGWRLAGRRGGCRCCRAVVRSAGSKYRLSRGRGSARGRR
jgi:hypothetical protein